VPGLNPIIGDFIEARVHCNSDFQLSLNVLHYELTAQIGGALTLGQMCTAFSAAIAPALKAWMPAAATYSFMTLQNLSPPKSVAVLSSVGSGVGTAAGNLVPRQVSGLARYRTDFAGRSNLGRSYIGFVADSSITPNGELTAGGITLLQAVMASYGRILNLTQGAVTTSMILSIRHPDNPGPPPTPRWTQVTATAASVLLATQRRRGDYGRPNID